MIIVAVKPFSLSETHDVTVLPAQTVRLLCQVGGDPPPKILWRRDDGEMPVGRAQILDDKSLSIEHVSLEDEGIYICDADNLVGSISVRTSLTVHCKLPTTLTCVSFHILFCFFPTYCFSLSVFLFYAFSFFYPFYFHLLVHYSDLTPSFDFLWFLPISTIIFFRWILRRRSSSLCLIVGQATSEFIWEILASFSILSLKERNLVIKTSRPKSCIWEMFCAST